MTNILNFPSNRNARPGWVARCSNVGICRLPQGSRRQLVMSWSRDAVSGKLVARWHDIGPRASHGTLPAHQGLSASEPDRRRFLCA